MTAKVNLDNIAIVLVQPLIPENIGSVARAMDNMGLSRLVLVQPKNCDRARILKPATGSSVDIIDKMEIYEQDLQEALTPFQYIVGTTTRTGNLRPSMTQPRRLAGELIPISQKNLVAILFGREDSGLTNEHLHLCHSIATIPTAHFPSLNLSQAVMVVSYELFMAGLDTQPKSVPRLANNFELEGMYDHIHSVLKKIGFLNPQNPGHWMFYIRRFLSRRSMRAGETQLIRGICRQLNWYTDQYEQMRAEKAKKTNP